MINELKNNINTVCRANRLMPSSRLNEVILIYLIYLKYLCEVGKYDYEEVINSENIYDIVLMPKALFKNLNEHGLAINSILRNYNYCKSRDLVIELIKSYDNEFKFLNDNKRIVYVIGRPMWPNSYNTLDVYDIKGNTTYITENNAVKNYYSYFKVFDEILGIHNEYYDEDKIDYEKYDNLYIYDNVPKYLKKDDDMYRYIYNHLSHVKNVVLYSKYSKVSNFKEGIVIADYIKTIIIKDNNVIIIFNKKVSEISIINGNNPKITNIEKLNEIITNNRKQKDILAKTNCEELRKNGMRIGFNLYQMEKDDNVIDINKIVDENTDYLKELNNLNEIVERETNKIFNL